MFQFITTLFLSGNEALFLKMTCQAHSHLFLNKTVVVTVDVCVVRVYMYYTCKLVRQGNVFLKGNCGTNLPGQSIKGSFF